MDELDLIAEPLLGQQPTVDGVDLELLLLDLELDMLERPRPRRPVDGPRCRTAARTHHGTAGSSRDAGSGGCGCHAALSSGPYRIGSSKPPSERTVIRHRSRVARR
ncbi:hypothetical protein ACWPOB_10540 [Rhodococcus sp. 2H158]